MTTLFGVSVWIHSIFILILGILLLIHLLKGDDVKEPFQTVTTRAPDSGSPPIQPPPVPGASTTGLAYDLTGCVPGASLTFLDGSKYTIGSKTTFSVEDCPALSIQKETLKSLADNYFETNQLTSLQHTQSSLCSLNITIVETGCNSTNSIPPPVTSPLETLKQFSIEIPSNIITGSMNTGSNIISTSANASAIITLGSKLYIGDYPKFYAGPFFVISVNNSSINVSSTNNIDNFTGARIFWSPMVGRSNTPLLRSVTNNPVVVDIYNGYRYALLQDSDQNLPSTIMEGWPLFFGNCSTVTGPYVAGASVSVDRILLGQYIGTGGKSLNADQSFNEPNLLGGSIFVPIYASPIILAPGTHTTCEPGLFLYDRNCFICPAGSYCPAGATFPTSCALGTYNPNNGGTSNSVCLPCPAGTVCPVGTSTPSQSPAGYYSSGTTFTQCPTGTYNPTPGSTSSSACLPCPEGSYCPAVSRTAASCSTPAGSSVKLVCPQGFYCPARVARPVSCPTGTFSAEIGATSISSCGSCPAGFYSDELDSVNCKGCEPGHYCPAGSISHNLCPAGTYTDKGFQTACITCVAGKFAEPGSTSCSTCSPGTYSENGAGSCTTCPAGYYCPGGTDKISCGSRKFSQVASDDPTKCLDCPAGYYCPGGTDKVPCNAGSYSNVGGGSESSCIPCSIGTYSDNPSSGSCKMCQPGTSSYSGGTSCYTCPAGTYSWYGSSCIACGHGLYSSSPGSSSCSACAAGTYSESGATQCSTCSAGYYCRGGEYKTACPAGWYSAATGATGQGTCRECPAGKYSVAGSTGCTTCAAGKISTAGSGSCSSCPDDSIGDATRTRCSTCALGKYANSTRTECLACPPGYFGYPFPGYCAACPAGQYTDTAGQTECLVCPPGYTTGGGQLRGAFSRDCCQNRGGWTFNTVVYNGPTYSTTPTMTGKTRGSPYQC